MVKRIVLGICLATCGSWAQGTEEEVIDEELQRSSELHMREELGVNPITAPSIQEILSALEVFRPVPLALIESANHEASFNNRFQTAMHFGSLVADGFMLTLAERSSGVQEVGKAILRQSRALGVGDNLTKRSKSLMESASKGDWLGMRQELINTQEDVEKSMLALKDEEMAHIISLGGWLRGFQLGANNTAENFTPSKAAVLGQMDILEYFLERLSTLNPRLKKTELVSTIVDRLTAIREVAMDSAGRPLTAEQVAKMRDLANDAEAAAMSRVDEDGKFVTAPRTTP